MNRQAEPGDLRALKRRIHELEGEVLGYKQILAEQEKSEPICYISGTRGGRFVVQPTDPAMVLPTGMALFAAPPAQEKPSE